MTRQKFSGDCNDHFKNIETSRGAPIGCNVTLPRGLFDYATFGFIPLEAS